MVVEPGDEEIIDDAIEPQEKEQVIAERLMPGPPTLEYRRPAVVTGRRTHEAVASFVILAVCLGLAGFSSFAREMGGACIAMTLFPVGMLLAILAVMDPGHQRKMALVALAVYTAILFGGLSLGILGISRW